MKTIKYWFTSNAVKSLYGTQLNPGMYGPYPSKLSGSVDADIAASDLPQKFSVANITLASLFAIFFFLYAHFLANFIEASSASTPKCDRNQLIKYYFMNIHIYVVPVFIGNALSYPINVHIFSANSGNTFE